MSAGLEVDKPEVVESPTLCVECVCKCLVIRAYPDPLDGKILLVTGNLVDIEQDLFGGSDTVLAPAINRVFLA